MKIAVVGTGYVGLVTGTCFADSGNQVTCVDIDAGQNRTADPRQHSRSTNPVWPRSSSRNAAAGRLHFTTDLAQAVNSAELVYLAVGTPSGDARAKPICRPCGVSWIRSPPHSADDGDHGRQEHRTGGHQCPRGSSDCSSERAACCDVASNPEFLKEGAAINDFMFPDRVVVGVRRPEVAEILHELYAPSCGPTNRFSSCRPRVRK